MRPTNLISTIPDQALRQAFEASAHDEALHYLAKAAGIKRPDDFLLFCSERFWTDPQFESWPARWSQAKLVNYVADKMAAQGKPCYQLEGHEWHYRPACDGLKSPIGWLFPQDRALENGLTLYGIAFGLGKLQDYIWHGLPQVALYWGFHRHAALIGALEATYLMSEGTISLNYDLHKWETEISAILPVVRALAETAP